MRHSVKMLLNIETHVFKLRSLGGRHNYDIDSATI